MSPTLGQGYGTNPPHPSPPPGGDGLQHSGSMPPRESGQSGAVGLEPDTATGGALGGGTGQHESSRGSGEVPPMSTTSEGGESAHQIVPGNTPGGSPGLETSTGMPGTASGDVEGFLTPRSQQGQGLPTIAKMVEGFPGAGLQLMSRVGDFFRVARTEVMQVPVWQDSHATPPRSATRSLGSPGGAPGQLALGDGSLGSKKSGSSPQMGPQGTPTSFAPSHPGREGPLLNADMLQRMQALR